MKTKHKLQQIAHKVIAIEIESLNLLRQNITEELAVVVTNLFRCKGRLIVTGVGKSSFVGRKIVATFNSIGKSSTFLHAADAIHGDIGMIMEEDMVLIISKSGETPELKVLIPLLKAQKVHTIGMVSEKSSYLSQAVDFFLYTPYMSEADPYNLVPTSSVISQMAMGDAMAMIFVELSDFSKEEFAKYHPGGMIGKQLYLRVEDLIGDRPVLALNSNLKEIVIEISSKRLGAAVVIEDGKIMGIITDGDLRRAMMKTSLEHSVMKAKDIMNTQPKVIQITAMVTEALVVMKKYNITQLLVLNREEYVGILHLHDVLKEGFL